jgi:hypothetical protein
LNKILPTLLTLTTLSFASFNAIVVDSKTQQPLKNTQVNDSIISIQTDINGSFSIDTKERKVHIKQYGYRPLSIDTNSTQKIILLESIKVKALYLTFWGASNNSKTLKRVVSLIEKTEANAIIVDVKNEYGSTSFLTSFKQANSYGAQEHRTNRNIKKFINLMKEKHIYTIARIVTFKDELQASNNPDYAIKRDDNGSIWRNHDKMAWVDPYDARSQEYAIRMAEEAAKVGFDEINFDYIRFPAKKGLRYSKDNNVKNRVAALSEFLAKAQKRLQKYGVFISVDTYGNILWSRDGDDNSIGQIIESLALHADYLAPMLYPSGFSKGSFHFKYPSDHPHAVIYRSIKNIKDRIDTKRIRPWLQYFKDYTSKRRPYKKFEVQEQIRATEELDTNGWMLWSPSSKYHFEYLTK